MKIRYDAISDVGRMRANNEDMALVFGAFIRDDAQSSMVPMDRRPRFTALVADGMGGYGGGEIASAMALASFNEFLAALPDGLSVREVQQAVRDWMRTIQDDVLAKAATDHELTNMGTTLTGLFTYGPYDFMINAGDSRVYRWRYDSLRQLTIDHSERQRTGNPLVPSNLIYNAIGVPGAFVDITCLSNDMPVIDGDIYIICSDGLCDMIDDAAISAILADGGGARRLVEAALEAGGADNCTVVMLHVSAPDIPETETETSTDTDTDTGACRPTPPPVLTPLPILAPSDAPAQDGFDIDEPADKPTPVPPPFPAPAPETVTETETETTDETQPLITDIPSDSAAQRVRKASGLLREAWQVMFGKKK